jgi:hypothetical protein
LIAAMAADSSGDFSQPGILAEGRRLGLPCSDGLLGDAERWVEL